MANTKIDVIKLDIIIKKAVESINNSKTEIYEIADNARRDCKRLEAELKELQANVQALIVIVRHLEEEWNDSKRKLMLVNKNYNNCTQEQLKDAYEKADNLRVQLAVKREQEQQYIRRRNELEIRIKESYSTIQKAESLITNVGVALGYLTGELLEISTHLEDIQQRQLLGFKIIKAQEDERQRVARDIHDGPAQLMSNVVLKAEICERMIDVDLEKTRDELKNLKKIVRESLRDVRKIIYNLRPMSLDDLGLIPTLQRYILTFQEETGISVSFKTKGLHENMKPVISLTVFRIVQEAINNIIKHAQSKNVSITLEFTDMDLKLQISDDGKGFDLEKQKEKTDDMNSGFGLYSMRERVELLGGKLVISSEQGKGTRLNIAIPFIQKEGATNE